MKNPVPPKLRVLDETLPIAVRTMFVKLIEECTEIQKPTCKALIAGLDECHSLKPEEGTYREQMATELGDLMGIATVLFARGYLDFEQFSRAQLVRISEMEALLKAHRL